MNRTGSLLVRTNSTAIAPAFVHPNAPPKRSVYTLRGAGEAQMTTTTDCSDTTFERSLGILDSEWRLGILLLLLDEGSLPVEDLPDHLDVEGDPAQCIIRLHHVDLPKLESKGYVGWDRERGRLRRGEGFDEIRPFLELLVVNGDKIPKRWL